MSPLERHLEETGVAASDPGRRLARSIASSSGTAMVSVADRDGDNRSVAPKSSGHTEGSAAAKSSAHTGGYTTITANIHVQDAGCGGEAQEALALFHEAQVFFATRVETAEATAFIVSNGKMKQRAALEQRGKLLFYNKVSEGLQRLLDESRLKE